MRFIPRTLLGRNVVLLVSAVLVGQIATLIVFMVFIQHPRVEKAANLFASEIMTVNTLLSAVPDNERAAYIKRLPPGMVAEDEAGVVAGGNSPFVQPNYEARFFLKSLASRLPDNVSVSWKALPTPSIWLRVPIDRQFYWISLEADISAHYPGILVTLFLSVVLGTIATLAAYLLHRKINRPLQQLLNAADHLGGGGWPEPLSVSGPSELAVVANTFNRMTEGLVEIESTRAAMLAGISHDIRTPLTKLRLALAMPETLDAPLSSAERFVDEIDVILQQFIDFARGGDGEDASIGDLDELIEQLANDFAGLGHPFKLSLGIAHAVSFRPVSTLRMLMNVMQNAVTYGQVGLEVETWSDNQWAYVCVHDSGPGIPEALLSIVKQPFRRGPQIGYQRPGTGLGLAIANRIARQHGGSLDLSHRQHGGLSVQISLKLTNKSD